MEEATQLRSIDDALRDIAERLTVIEERTRGPAALAAELPNLAAAVGDVFDSEADKLGDAADRLKELMALAERLSRPDTLRALRVVVDLAEQAPNTVAIVADSLEEALATFEVSGKKLDVVLGGLAETGRRSLELLASPEFHALLDSPMFDPRMLETLSAVSRAVVESSQQGTEPLGFFGALRAMGQAPVQRAVGLALGVAAKFGAAMDSHGRVRAALPPAGPSRR